MSSNTDDYDLESVVGSSPWFKDAPEQVQRDIIAAGHIKRFPRNNYVFRAGESGSELYCILSGRIRLSITSAIGQRFAIKDLIPVTWYGEMVLAGDQARVLEARVAEDADLLVIARHEMERICADHPLIYRNILIELINRTRGMYIVLSGMAFYPLKARLAVRLLELTANHGRPTGDGLHLDVKLSQSDFAQLSMGSRQRVNKIFSKWREQGIVDIVNSHYLIKDLAALEAETELTDQ